MISSSIQDTKIHYEINIFSNKCLLCLFDLEHALVIRGLKEGDAYFQEKRVIHMKF